MNESIIIGAAARDAWRGEKARGIVGGGSIVGGAIETFERGGLVIVNIRNL